MGKLDGKAAVITGGASGIGAATARLFAREGARVVIADVQDAAGEALAAELGAAAVYQHVDVSREDDVRGAVQRATSAFERLDCMFNNAGILGTVGPLEDIPVDEYDRTMGVLLRSVFLGMKYAAPVMKAQGSGSIISTSSIAGIVGGDGPHIYSVAKAAIIHLTKSAALELGPHGVRVNCICPGGILTPMATGSLAASPEVNDAVAGVLAGFQPIPRAGMPDDIAQAALWLASDDSTFVSGHALVVDGAAAAGTPWKRQPVPFRTHRPMP
jgi:NAD(P)-dependent dehydrogenase (short-subunit alcohol dehydrogenase family)